MSNYQVEDLEFQALQGKVVLITGAATGIGYSIAELAHRMTVLDVPISCVLSFARKWSQSSRLRRKRSKRARNGK